MDNQNMRQNNGVVGTVKKERDWAGWDGRSIINTTVSVTWYQCVRMLLYARLSCEYKFLKVAEGMLGMRQAALAHPIFVKNPDVTAIW